MSVSGAWDLLSCYRKDQSAVGRPGLRPVELKLYLVRVKNVLLLLSGLRFLSRLVGSPWEPSGTMTLIYLVVRNIESGPCMSFV